MDRKPVYWFREMHRCAAADSCCLNPNQRHSLFRDRSLHLNAGDFPRRLQSDCSHCIFPPFQFRIRPADANFSRVISGHIVRASANALGIARSNAVSGSLSFIFYRPAEFQRFLFKNRFSFPYHFCVQPSMGRIIASVIRCRQCLAGFIALRFHG